MRPVPHSVTKLYCFFLIPLYLAAQGKAPATPRRTSGQTKQGPSATGQPGTASKRTPTQAPDPLKRLVGAWDTTFTLLAGELAFGTGRATIEWVDSDTISFSISRSQMRQRQYTPGGPVIPEFVAINNDFTLKRGATTNRYLLTVQSRFGASFENFPLSYQKDTGFQGEGIATVNQQAAHIKASIEFEKTGGHNWTINAISANIDSKEARIGYYSITFSGNKPSSPDVKASEASTAESRTKSVSPPILLAAKEGNIAKVNALLRSGVSPDTADAGGNTALMQATASRNIKIVQMLLARNANVTTQNLAGDTALIRALRADDPPIVELLLAHGADPNRADVLRRAAMLGASEVVKALVAKGADVNARDEEGLTGLAAVMSYTSKKPAVIQALLEKGADANVKGILDTPVLIQAIDGGRTDLVRMLLEKGADPDTQSSIGDPALVLAIVRNGANALEIVKMLLDKGADANSKNPRNGATPLSAAAWGSFLSKSHRLVRTAVAQALLDKGADPNAMVGGTPVISIAAGSLDGVGAGVITALLNKGADINAKDGQWETALFSAVTNDIEIVNLLLDKGADVNARDRRGQTALFLASKNGKPDIVRLLLDKGADVNVETPSGDTPLKIAKSYGKEAVIALLQQAGARK